MQHSLLHVCSIRAALIHFCKGMDYLGPQIADLNTELLNASFRLEIRRSQLATKKSHDLAPHLFDISTESSVQCFLIHVQLYLRI